MSAVQERLEEATKRGRKLTRRGRRNLEKQLKQLDKQRQKLAKQTARRAKELRKQRPDGGEALEAAREGAASVGKALAALGAATAAAATPLLERARSGELQEQARERAAELTERVREEYVPQAREAAQRAGTRVSELATTGVAAGRSALQSLASSDAAERAGEAAEEAGKRTREAAEEARKRARRGGTVVTTATGRAVRATGSGLKETTLIAFWATALGALVYNVFLNEEQREKVASTAKSLFEQTQELIRDFQGYDEEF